MTKKTTKKSLNTTVKRTFFSPFKNSQFQTILGIFLLFFSIFLTIAFISFFFHWQDDQSTLTELTNKAVTSKNLLGKIGAKLSHVFIYQGFGLATFFIPYLVFISGWFQLLNKPLSKLIYKWNWNLILMLWLSITLGFLSQKYALLAGVIGFEINQYLSAFIGKTGLAIVLFFLFLAYIVVRFKVTPESIAKKFPKKEKKTNQEKTAVDSKTTETTEEKVAKTTSEEKTSFKTPLENLQPTIKNYSKVSTEEASESGSSCW